MQKSSRRYPARLVPGLIPLLALTWLPAAQAETTECTPITSLPAVITTQGIYCLTDNLNTDMAGGVAIEIQTNNVTIDMNGYKLGDLAAGAATQATGIYAYQRKNITIRNGVIRGFLTGIYLADGSPFTASQGHLIEDVLADGNTYTGMRVMGSDNRVRNNQVVRTGGSSVASISYGIEVVGPGARITGNSVSGTTGVSGSYGISVSGGDGDLISRNFVSDTTSTTGTPAGIYVVDGTDYVLARDNTVINAYYGLRFYSSLSKYVGNMTQRCTNSFSGGTAIGDNY